MTIQNSHPLSSPRSFKATEFFDLYCSVQKTVSELYRAGKKRAGSAYESAQGHILEAAYCTPLQDAKDALIIFDNLYECFIQDEMSETLEKIDYVKQAFDNLRDWIAAQAEK